MNDIYELVDFFLNNNSGNEISIEGFAIWLEEETTYSEDEITDLVDQAMNAGLFD